MSSLGGETKNDPNTIPYLSFSPRLFVTKFTANLFDYKFARLLSRLLATSINNGKWSNAVSSFYRPAIRVPSEFYKHPVVISCVCRVNIEDIAMLFNARVGISILPTAYLWACLRAFIQRESTGHQIIWPSFLVNSSPLLITVSGYRRSSVCSSRIESNANPPLYQVEKIGKIH